MSARKLISDKLTANDRIAVLFVQDGTWWYWFVMSGPDDDDIELWGQDSEWKVACDRALIAYDATKKRAAGQHVSYNDIKAAYKDKR